MLIRNWNQGTLIKTVNGVKVGLFGLTAPGLALAKPKPCVINDPTSSAQSAVAALQASGARVIVALSHGGMVQARALAGAVPGIDVIVNAHDNAVLEQPEAVARPGGGVTRIVSAGDRYEWVGRLQLLVSGGDVSLVSYALVHVSDAIAPDPAMQSAIDALKVNIVAHYGDVYHLPLASAQDTIAAEWDPRHAKRDSPLGNLFTDAYRWRTGTEVALEGIGDLSDALPVGWVVGADVFRSMYLGPITVNGQLVPQPWRLVTFRTTGTGLLAVLKATITAGGNSFPQVSGIRFDYTQAGGTVLLDNVHVGGHKLREDQLYSVTVTEGVYPLLAAILAKLSIPTQDVTPLADLAFDAARQFISTQGVVIDADSSNRIRDVGAIGK